MLLRCFDCSNYEARMAYFTTPEENPPSQLFPPLATVSSDKPSSDPQMYITALQEQF
jgi:hypothetical protein